jgi:hypothetical protein
MAFRAFPYCHSFDERLQRESPPEMELRVSAELHPKNLAGIRAVLTTLNGMHVVDLTQAVTGGKLVWTGEADGANYTLHLDIPQSWLDDPTRVHDVQESARAFVKRVLTAGGSNQKAPGH